MQRSTFMFSLLGAWALAIVYDWIKVNTGLEITVLLGISILTMIISIYLFCRKPKETDEGEA